jgi:hypothetical protein
MTSDERADWLARAIDEILRHGEPPAAPDGLDQAELSSLLDAARLRRDAAEAARLRSADHESEVWKRLIERLTLSQESAPRRSSKRTKGPPADEDGELRQVIGMRMQIAREALDLAEEHRDEVWERVKSRLGATEHASAIHAKLTEQPAPQPPPNVPERRRRLQSQQTPLSEELPRERWAGLPYLAVVIAIALAAAAVTAFELL